MFAVQFADVIESEMDNVGLPDLSSQPPSHGMHHSVVSSLSFYKRHDIDTH